METLMVDYAGGLKFRTLARTHEIISDQPLGKGEDTGPTPPELFIAAIGSCIGVYACFFAQRHDISLAGMKIEMSWEKAENPGRIGNIRAKMIIPGGVPEQYREPLHRAAHACLLHNTLLDSPRIELTIE